MAAAPFHADAAAGPVLEAPAGLWSAVASAEAVEGMPGAALDWRLALATGWDAAAAAAAAAEREPEVGPP